MQVMYLKDIQMQANRLADTSNNQEVKLLAQLIADLAYRCDEVEAKADSTDRALEKLRASLVRLL